jgi:cold shock CspA family protein
MSDRHLGTVTSFDGHVGLGQVTEDDGAEWMFHCVEIADGSRQIAVGANVQFGLRCKLGRYEAANVRPA